MAEHAHLPEAISLRPLPGRRGRDDAGFTLVEMLVTIVVLAMLSSVAIIGVAAMRRGSETDACGTDARRFRAAQESYALDQGLYGTEQQLVAAGLLSQPSDLHDVTLIDGSYQLVATGECVGVTTT